MGKEKSVRIYQIERMNRMGTLVTAPGVLGSALTTYVTASDVKKLLGCKDNKAYQVIRDVNKIAVKGGNLPYGQGKASKYLFSEKFGIPMEVVNSVIKMKEE